jgi:hypothetical protein
MPAADALEGGSVIVTPTQPEKRTGEAGEAARPILPALAPTSLPRSRGSPQYHIAIPAALRTRTQSEGNLWDEIREKIFKSYALKSIDAVYTKLNEAIGYINRNLQLVKSITSFPYIVRSF